ncbi:V-type ATP synthase subunit E [Candidatus Omnitrophus magneticus]|uniref:V-type ATP synthase subunit E n=1 Tax=Candidatus Omnitrophus magneticus TaxID=1609969 RepID=A0A0F0CMD7_9BACT|nr:V-type ATP synthase subunit E [Candidatus Omnitrophus magneticus]
MAGGEMTIELAGIIEKIKRSGVEEAEKQAGEIIKNAERAAKEIILSAEEKSKNIIAIAQKESARVKETGETAIKQAARDSLIALKTRIIAMFDNIIKQEVATIFNPEILKEIILKMVIQCGKEKNFDLEILLNEQDKASLRGIFENALQKELKQGVTIKTAPSLHKGFRIGEKGTNLYYDFSDEAISETLMFYMNKKIKEILEKGVDNA